MSGQTAIVTRPYDARMAGKPPAEIDHETAFYDSAGSYNLNTMIEAVAPTKLMVSRGPILAAPLQRSAPNALNHS
jgi:hypothetical protein